MKKIMYLGTAGWGENISKIEAFSVIEEFYSKGFHLIDSASNYPINGKKEDFGLANSWLIEWIRSVDCSQTKVFVKIGSVDNTGGDRTDLSAQKVREEICRLQDDLGNNLYGVGIHWDNRVDPQQIFDTLLTIQAVCPKNYQLGISGVKFPSIYKQSLTVGTDWEIQIKNYPGNETAIEKYLEHFPINPFIAYGLKHFLKQEVLRGESEKSKKYLQGIRYYLNNNHLSGFIVSPRTKQQAEAVLHECLTFKADAI
jgi:hypothetical protein